VPPATGALLAAGAAEEPQPARAGTIGTSRAARAVASRRTRPRARVVRNAAMVAGPAGVRDLRMPDTTLLMGNSVTAAKAPPRPDRARARRCRPA